MSGSTLGFPAFSAKDPDDVDIFAFDVTADLSVAESVVSAVFLVAQFSPVPVSPTPTLVAALPVLSGSIVTAWLSGGTLGATYVVSVEFVTSQQRTIRRSARLLVAHN